MCGSVHFLNSHPRTHLVEDSVLFNGRCRRKLLVEVSSPLALLGTMLECKDSAGKLSCRFLKRRVAELLHHAVERVNVGTLKSVQLLCKTA